MFGDPKHAAMIILSKGKEHAAPENEDAEMPGDELPDGLEDAIQDLFEDCYAEKEGKPLSTEEKARLAKRARAFRAAFQILENEPHEESEH